MASLSVVQGDITALDVDAIVNAANERMLGGGGVDGAIHRAAGPRLLDACRAVPQVRPAVRCPTGEARITSGFELRARHVIHTVGPVWRGGGAGEDALLSACYRSALGLASQHGLASIAFPSISCGVYGFPAERASALAVAEVVRTVAGMPGIQRVLFVAFDDAMARTLRAAVAAAAER